MSNIKTQSPIRYCIDKLNTSSYGVIITKSGSEIDCSSADSITGFEISHSQPSGTFIYLLFKTSDNSNWFKLTSSGERSNITASTPDYEILSTKGNTVAELNVMKSIAAFKGKKILIAVGLGSSDKNNAVPKIKLGLKATKNSQTLTTTEYSPLYEIGDSGQIATINFSPSTTGDGSVKVYGQLTKSDGSISEWQAVSSLAGEKCRAIKLRADYSVKTIGSDSAKLESTDVIYSTGQTLITGAGSGELISLTQDWYMNIRHCRMTIRHAPLVSSKLEAYVCFRERPKVTLKEQLGIGAGKTTTYQLKNPSGLKYDTVKIYFDNERVYSDFEVNSEVGRVTCTAPSGVIITCDYESNWGLEDWQKMTQYRRESLDDYDETEFRYSRPDTETQKTVCAVKLVMTTTSGKITNESIGRGTGKAQTYKLNKRVKDGAITIYSNGTAMSKSAYYLLEDTQYVKVAAASGATLTATYTWISESPAVYQFAAVFSE